jgi:hypothetical protein
VRSLETLKNCREELTGLAFASPEQLEAFALYREAADGHLDVLALGDQGSERRELFLTLVLRALADRSPLPLRLPGLASDEVPMSVLQDLGWIAGETCDLYSAVATPA